MNEQPDLNARNGWFQCQRCSCTRPLRELSTVAQVDAVLNLRSTAYVCKDDRMCELLRVAHEAAQARHEAIQASHEAAIEERVRRGEAIIDAEKKKR